MVGDPFYNAGHMQRILRGCAVDGWDFENLTLPQWLHPQVGLGLQAFELEFPDPHPDDLPLRPSASVATASATAPTANAVASSGHGESSMDGVATAAAAATASASAAPAAAIERKDGRIRVSVGMPAEWQSMQPAPIGSFRTL